MKAVVTGGAGFLGSYVVQEFLKDGFEVLVLDNLENGKESYLEEIKKEVGESLGSKLLFHKVDITRDPLSGYFKNAKVVLHLASFSSVLSSFENPQKNFQVNVIGAERVLAAALENGVSVFVNANSAEALFGKSLNLPYDEKTGFDPQSPFAGAKAAFELYLLGLSKGLKHHGKLSSDPAKENYFTWVSFRLPHVYGERTSKYTEAPFIGYCLESIARGVAPTLVDNGQRSRDYCGADDIARAFLMASRKALETCLDDVFNVGSGQETRDIEVFELMKHHIQKASLDFDDASRFQKALMVSEPKFVSAKSHETPRSFVNPLRAQAFFGWKATQSIHAAIPQIVTRFFAAK
jgi:UDP-glucose 4-epimerase